MTDLQHLSEISLDKAGDWIKDLNDMLGHEEDTKERVSIIRAGTKLLEMILDRTHPKRTTNRNENLTLDIAGFLKPLPKKLLTQVQEHLRLQESPKHVESESRPI